MSSCYICVFVGHEQPFAIQLSHDRDAEELDPNIKCQFILRENKKQMKLGNTESAISSHAFICLC